MTGGKRPGRPWSPPKGSCQEINDLVALIRDWLDGAGITVRGLHAALTPDHFADKGVPDERRLRERLAGVGLTWDTVEAVADICFACESHAVVSRRLERAQDLWRASKERPTVIGADGEPAVPARDLLLAQERAIGALEELNRVRKAYEASERARNQSLQMATVLFALLGQAQAQVQELTRRLESLQASPDALSREIDSAHLRLLRASTQEDGLRTQLVRAQTERERAQALADLAARRIQELECGLRGLGDRGDDAVDSGSGTVMLPQQVFTADADTDDRLDQVDATLQKAREALDREHETVQGIAHDLVAGYGTQAGAEAVQVRAGGPGDLQAVPEDRLFKTTPNKTGSAASDIVVRRQADRMQFVGSATRRIARGMYPDEIVLALRRAAVPVFTDAVLVYLLDPLYIGDRPVPGQGDLRLQFAEQPPEEQADSIISGLGIEARADFAEPSRTSAVRPGGPLSLVLQGVRPVFGDVAHRKALSELLGDGFSWPRDGQSILAPLRGRQRVVGIAVFLRQHERVAFEPDDLQVAAQLTTQTALGIDKALLYGHDAYKEGELQRRMLPSALPNLPGVQLACRYLPAYESWRAGGDWYDVIALPDGRVALMVGDVMGYSITSAAIMGQLRTTAQTLAGLGMSATMVLRNLDQQAQRLGSDRLATFLYAEYNPVAHHITVASAGHLPAILLHPDGQAQVVQVPPGAPIGVGDPHLETATVAAPAGSTLLLYTNGLLTRVDSSYTFDVSVEIERLRERVAGTAHLSEPVGQPPLEELCDLLLGMNSPGSPRDDIALLAARLEGLSEARAESHSARLRDEDLPSGLR
ncbi:SpoIIE family protein phosphatase [Streptomyces sp. NPDC090088]|uniref:SpoIIE family protein phosphatase n=1 Tax=Streptomyces sp. NPDC090088 TaxID=3365944 RepID=UPI0037FD4A31